MIVKYIAMQAKCLMTKLCLMLATQHDFLSDFKYGHVCMYHLSHIYNDFLDRLTAVARG